MGATSLFRVVICRWMVNKLQTGRSKKIYVQNAKCNFHLLLKLKCLNTWCTSISIMNWGNSHISQNHNQADVKIMWKKTSHTKLSWVWDELYALISHNMKMDIKSRTTSDSTCFHKWNFPCDDQICINDTLSLKEWKGVF